MVVGHIGSATSIIKATPTLVMEGGGTRRFQFFHQFVYFFPQWTPTTLVTQRPKDNRRMIFTRKYIVYICSHHKRQVFFISIIPQFPDWRCMMLNPAERRFTFHEQPQRIAGC